MSETLDKLKAKLKSMSTTDKLIVGGVAGAATTGAVAYALTHKDKEKPKQ